jgi:two-component system sensor histidine kinase DctS
MEVFEREPAFERVSVADLFNNAMERLLTKDRYMRPRVETEIAAGASYMLADRSDMEALFEHLLENSLEALDRTDPLVRMTTLLLGAPPHSLTVEIFNSGHPLETDDTERLFSPFYSTKSEGTGFGLAIALQAVRNNLGHIRLEPVADKGTKAVLTLPVFE